jgi:hypothetical protein
LLTAPNAIEGGIEFALAQLHLRQRTQIIIARQGDEGARGMSRHLAVADTQQATAAQTLLHPLDTRHIQRVIGVLARHHIGSHRHPQRIENRLHHFDLRQIRTVILAMAKLK